MPLSNVSIDAPSPMFGVSSYSSCAPITISGRSSPARSTRVGVAMSSPPSRTPESSVNVTRCDTGSIALDLGRVDREHREAGHRRSVVMPRVHVAVEGGTDDLELAVTVEIGRGRRAREAGLGPVELILGRRVVARERGIDVRAGLHAAVDVDGFEPAPGRAARAPGPDVAVRVTDDDFDLAVTVEIGDDGRTGGDRGAGLVDVLGGARSSSWSATTARRACAPANP